MIYAQMYLSIKMTEKMWIEKSSFKVSQYHFQKFTITK